MGFHLRWWVDMQMAYTPRAWVQERTSWKAVIQLNLIRSINTIVDALAEELAHHQPPVSQAHSGPPSPSSDDGSSGARSAATATAATTTTTTAAADQVLIPADRRGVLMKLRMRLTPLRQVEVDLKARLGAGTSEVSEAAAAALHGEHPAGLDAMMATPFDDAAYASAARRFNPKDVVVRSHRAWKEREKARKDKDRGSLLRPNSPGSSASDKRDSATEVLAGCAEDVAALWLDPVVREIVHKRRLMSSLGDSAE